MRDANVATIFLKSVNPNITADIVKVDGGDKKGMFGIDITIGGVKKSVDFPYAVENGVISAAGKIDVLDFGVKESFDMYAKKCAPFHQKKSWTDVDIAFTLPIK